jgi:hypothetical protein
MQRGLVSAIRPKLFECAKAPAPIAHPSGLVHDALIQAALDPTIRKIECLEQSDGTTDEIIVRMRGARIHLDITALRSHRTIAGAIQIGDALRRGGIVSLKVTDADILRDPGFSNARLVWSVRSSRITADMQFRALDILDQEGPMSLHWLCSMLAGPQDAVESRFRRPSPRNARCLLSGQTMSRSSNRTVAATKVVPSPACREPTPDTLRRSLAESVG